MVRRSRIVLVQKKKFVNGAHQFSLNDSVHDYLIEQFVLVSESLDDLLEEEEAAVLLRVACLPFQGIEFISSGGHLNEVPLMLVKDLQLGDDPLSETLVESRNETLLYSQLLFLLIGFTRKKVVPEAEPVVMAAFEFVGSFVRGVNLFQNGLLVELLRFVKCDESAHQLQVAVLA